jgi:acetolactate synthase-1/2/3 large subunit
VKTTTNRSTTLEIAGAVRPREYNCVNLLLDYLHAEGTRYVFGVPGGALAEFMRAVSSSEEVEFVVSKHETGAAFMADGYARVSGKLGVCASTTGPGATNMLTGVSVAHFDGVPLLCISGATARGEVGRWALQETSGRGVDTASLYRTVSHFSEIVPSAEAMSPMLGSALRHCWAGARGAAYIGLPTDLSTAKLEPLAVPTSPSQYRGTSVACDQSASRRAAELLARARRPVFFVGSGTRGLVDRRSLVSLAERLGAPVATSCKAKGLFPEDHPLSLRNFGMAGSLWANEWMPRPDNDLILILGSSLNDWATGGWNRGLLEGRTVVQVDIEQRNICSWSLIDQAVIGDINVVLDSLHAHLDELDISPIEVNSRWQSVVQFKESKPRSVQMDRMHSPSTPLKPQRVIRELEEVLPEDAIVFVDSGNTTGWVLHYLTFRAEQQFHCCFRLLSMGYAFPASIGGKMAAPDKPVIAIGGDGALLMNGTELHTAVQKKLNLVWICFFDEKLGMVYHGNRAIIGSGVYSDLSPLDPVRFAESLGAEGIYVDRPDQLREVLPRALAQPHPTLLCVAVDPSESPPFGARFAALTKQMGKSTDGRR